MNAFKTDIPGVSVKVFSFGILTISANLHPFSFDIISESKGLSETPIDAYASFESVPLKYCLSPVTPK